MVASRASAHLGIRRSRTDIIWDGWWITVISLWTVSLKSPPQHHRIASTKKPAKVKRKETWAKDAIKRGVNTSVIFMRVQFCEQGEVDL